MKFIGITGGIGAGKSEIISYLAKQPHTRVMLADKIAHELMEPGTDCYDNICITFAGEDIFSPDGSFDRKKLATVIFSDEKKREQMNAIVHPAVKQYVIREANKERKKGEIKLLVLEAALLIEEHYDKICDELWYVYASEEVREMRLLTSRGYSREKIRQIFKSQMTEQVYRDYCAVTIDNNGPIEETLDRLSTLLSGYL